MEEELVLPLSSSSISATPTSCCSCVVAAGETSSSAEAGVAAELFEFQRQQILHKLQGTVDCYNDCFQSLRLALDDLELLRQENLALRGENLGLSLLLEEREKEVLSAAPGGGGALGASSGIRQIGAVGTDNVPPEEGIDAGNGKTGAHGVVPKSISIRSKGFLAAKDPASGGGCASPEDVGGSSDTVFRPSRPLPLDSLQVRMVHLTVPCAFPFFKIKPIAPPLSSIEPPPGSDTLVMYFLIDCSNLESFLPRESTHIIHAPSSGAEKHGSMSMLLL